MALHYTVRADQLSERDIYDITPVASLKKFLKPEHSLCIVRTPIKGQVIEGIRVMGKNRRGEELRVYLCESTGSDLGYAKCKLDKILFSPFLFVSWKQGRHTFKMVQKRQVLAEYPDFDSTLAAYFPDGFIPEKSYERNHSVFELMCRSLQRRCRLANLLWILKEYGKAKGVL